MQSKRIILGGIAAFAVMFILGGIWNAGVMADFYASNSPRIARSPEDVSMTFIILGYVVMTFFMVFLFAQSFAKKPSLMEGFQFGALFGLIATLPVYLLLYGGWDLSLPMLLVDSGWHLVEQGMGGVTLALVLFPKTSKARVTAGG